MNRTTSTVGFPRESHGFDNIYDILYTYSHLLGVIVRDHRGIVKAMPGVNAGMRFSRKYGDRRGRVITNMIFRYNQV